jgi:hypothetical protein
MGLHIKMAWGMTLFIGGIACYSISRAEKPTLLLV